MVGQHGADLQRDVELKQGLHLHGGGQDGLGNSREDFLKDEVLAENGLKNKIKITFCNNLIEMNQDQGNGKVILAEYWCKRTLLTEC